MKEIAGDCHEHDGRERKVWEGHSHGGEEGRAIWDDGMPWWLEYKEKFLPC